MKKLFDKPLRDFEKSFLLEGIGEYEFTLRLAGEMRSELMGLVKELTDEGAQVLSYRDVRQDGYTYGIPEQVLLPFAFLLKRSPNVTSKRATIEEALSFAKRIDLKRFLSSNYARAIKDLDILVSSVKVAEFVAENELALAGKFIRQIPHSESTKLLKENSLAFLLLSHLWNERIDEFKFYERLKLKSLPLKFDIYSDHLYVQGVELRNFECSVSKETSSHFGLRDGTYVVIVENLATFYALQSMLTGCLLILGSGGMAYRLKDLDNLLSGREIYYWGDLDKKGIEIFNGVKGSFPKTQAILMDMQTLLAHESIAIKSSDKKETRIAPSFLKEEYDYVTKRGLLLEQEKINLDLFLNALAKIRPALDEYRINKDR